VGLEVRKNRFAKSYENSFFRIFAKELIRVFDRLNLSGVLIGGGVTESNSTLAPDALLICNSAVVIIDFKKYSGKIKLPNHGQPGTSKTKDEWFHGWWVVNDGETIVKGGGRNNPFQQLEAQTKKLNIIVENNIAPFLSENEKYEFKDTSRVICFQLEVDFEGTVDPRHAHSFHVADQRTIIDTIRDVVDVVPNEWNDQITGFKLGQNAFDLFKKEFRADLYDPNAENQLYREQIFSDIEFPLIDQSRTEEIISEEINTILPLIDDFISGKEKLLVMNSNVTSFSFEVLNGILEKILKTDDNNEVDEVEISNENKVIFLAPTNKNVNDVIRDGAPQQTRSLYGKLYDFENSKIKLLNNSLNEREEFPLQKNKDPKCTIYVLYYSHLVYDYGSSDENSLIKFGSGSLAHDLLEYIDLGKSDNRLILIHDPYIYGNRAETIGSESFLKLNGQTFLNVRLRSCPKNVNESGIAHLVHNILGKKFNHFDIKQYPNILTKSETDFRDEFRRLVRDNEINNKIILSRENDEAKTINYRIRKERGFIINEVQKGDVLLIKNRILVPEETDPYSLPKFVQNGELVEVLEVLERKAFRSKKTDYKFKDIKVSKCRVLLKENRVERTLYLSDSSMDESDPEKELSKHRQIRLREIVAEYMENNRISEKDVFVDQKEYQNYLKELEEIEKPEGIFEGEVIELDQGEKGKRINKLKSAWKINKRKENYVKNELLKDFTSEYFMITQSGLFRYGWAINLHNAYGYRFSETMLPAFSKPAQNIERFHFFLYTAISVSNRLMCQSFNGINPWFGIETTTGTGELPGVSVRKEFMTELLSAQLSAEEIDFSKMHNMESVDPRLSILGNWILKQFKPEDAITVNKIIHNNYQEEYTFRNSIETSKIQFYYTGKWQVRYPKEIGNTALGKLIEERLKSSSSVTNSGQEEEFVFDGQTRWNLKQYERLKEILQIKGIKVTQVINKGEYHDLLKFEGENESGFMEIWHNKNHFFTKASVNTVDSEISSKIIDAINQLKND
jgi:hypothetical protein